MLKILNKVFRSLLWKLEEKNFFSKMNDEDYLKLIFKIRVGRKLDLKNPKSYNEKLQWLKLNCQDARLSEYVDKYEVKKLVSKKIGSQYVVRSLGVWEDANEISLEDLPDRFVLKCTHDSGNVYICRDKTTFNVAKAKRELNKSLKINYYVHGHEYPYRDVKPRIIAEELLGGFEKAPEDYKFYIFNGELYCVMVCADRKDGHAKYYYYDLDWNRIYCQYDEPQDPANIEKPQNYEQMISIVNKLTQGFKNVRIDLYNIDGNIYFGEYTFFNQDGCDIDITYETDLLFGKQMGELKII